MTVDKRLSAVAKARHAAIRRLISAHLAEFNGYLAEERRKRGLPDPVENAYLLRRRIEDLERALAAATAARETAT